MKRPLLLAFLSCLPFLGGCLLPYLGNPSIDYTSRVKLEVPRDEVRAFRVDIATSLYRPGLYGPSELFSSTTDTARLSEIPISHRDEVPGQLKASVRCGIVAIGPLIFRFGVSFSVAVRLYRPGYGLVEIGSWEGSSPVEWKPATDLLDQKKALDMLLAGELETGSTSKAHREALLFGAGEYDRLEKLATSEEQLFFRGKAQTLRDLAAK